MSVAKDDWVRRAPAIEAIDRPPRRPTNKTIVT
jgi:hypothetical protein